MNFSQYLSNAHTHSHYSDGHQSLEEMVEAACNLGFISLGITDHSPVFYENSFQIRSMEEYVKGVLKLKKEYSSRLEIVLGLEYDYDSDHPISDEIQYTIGSVHTLRQANGEIFKIENGKDNFIKSIDQYYDGKINRAWEHFFGETVKSSLRKEIDIIGHFDLIAKYNINNCIFDECDREYLSYAFDAVDTILEKKPNAIFEVNTGCMPRAGRASPYPSKQIIERIHTKKGRIILNSDAHRTRDINAQFDSILGQLSEIGFKSIVRVRNFGFEEISL